MTHLHGVHVQGCIHLQDVLCYLVGYAIIGDTIRHTHPYPKRTYARRKRSSMLYSPQGCCTTHFAARNAPLAKVSRLWDRWTSSKRSPRPPKSTVCSPTISPARTTWIPISVSERRPIIPRRPETGTSACELPRASAAIAARRRAVPLGASTLVR